MDNHLIRWNTARIIHKELGRLDFFKGYQPIDAELYDLYKEVTEYCTAHYAKIEGNYGSNYGYKADIYNEWLEYLDKLLEFQQYIAGADDVDKETKISDKAVELFDNKDVANVQFADLTMLNKLDILLEYSDAVVAIFNHIRPLVQSQDYPMNNDLESEIRQIIDSKGLGTFKIPDELLSNNLNYELS